MSDEHPDRERIDQNVQRTTALHALKEIRGIVEDDLRQEQARAKLLRTLVRYGLIILPLATWLLARFLGVV